MAVKLEIEDRLAEAPLRNGNYYTPVGISPDRWPKLQKRYVIAIATVLLFCLGLGIAYFAGAFDKKCGGLCPPNPTKPLPPSASKLHAFKRAAVCADSVPCAEIGRNILLKNGSAVDATIAAMFCKSVYTMQSMGLGGGLLMTIYIKENETAYTLNARETAPEKSAPDMFKGKPDASKHGPLAIGVPGQLRGYWAAYKRFGKLPWKDLVEPAIELCENGYQMSKHQYWSFQVNIQYNKKDELLRKWFLDENGDYKKAGSKIIPKELCETLKVIAENGGDDLYNGTLAKKLLEDLKNAGSVIDEADLANYEPRWEKPITTKLKNGDMFYSFPPPGSGALLAFILNILDGYNFTRDSIDGINNTVLTYHRIAEAFKYAYAKRTELGDTQFVNINSLLRNLTSPSYAAEVRQLIRDNETSNDPKKYGAVFYNQEDHGTAHISVLAENGDAVSVTSSINLHFGAGLTSKQTGIILNSVMDDFSSPDFVNYFGLPGSPNNAIWPGKRALSSMTPTIITDKNGDVKIVIGASGGTKITTVLAQVIMRTFWFGQNVKEAIDAPRLHHQVFPMELEYEYGTLEAEVKGLEALGHKTSRYSAAASIVCALLRIGELIYANADYRKGGDVFGID